MKSSVYFAGELFSLKHLAGNASLAESIEERSGGRIRCVLPQNLEQRETTPLKIRDNDLLSVVECDLGLFHFDGPELDSGTVAEFLFAKFLDIPAVLLRTDFRSAGDQQGDPWNLMLSNYPRTEVIVVDSMALYQDMLKKCEGKSFAAAVRATEDIADRVVVALDKVSEMPPLLSAAEQEGIYRWAVKSPGPSFAGLFNEDRLGSILDRKQSRYKSPRS